jgi:hypothetical protein
MDNRMVAPQTRLELAPACAGILAQYATAWERHGVLFGLTAERETVQDYDRLCRVHVTGWERLAVPAEGMARVLHVAEEPLTYRFSHSHPDRSRRGLRNAFFCDPHALSWPAYPEPDGGRTTLLFTVPAIFSTEGVRPAFFLEHLALFLEALPAEIPAALEVRNRNFLVPGYFDLLHACGVSHVLVHDPLHTHLADQLTTPGVLTGESVVVRLVPDADPDLVVALREVVRRCEDAGRPLRILIEGEAGRALRFLLLTMERLDAELARRSPLRRKAAA